MKTLLHPLTGLALTALLALPAVAQTLPDNVTLTNLTILGQPQTLQLYKRSVRSPNFHYLTWTAAEGYVTNSPTPVRTYRGTVVGAANTIVCATIKPGGLLVADGFDYEQGKSYTWQLNNVNVAAQLPPGSLSGTPSSWAESAPVTSISGIDPALDAPCGCPECGGDLPPAPPSSGTEVIELMGALPPSTYMPPAGGMQVMDLGIDITHNRYVNSYGGNADLAVSTIEHTVNIYDLLLARDAMIAVQETVVVLRQDVFYVPTGMGDQLNLMTSTWKAEPLMSKPWDQIHSFATEQGLFGAGGYAWGNSIGKDESPANVEALYHEAGHNWDVVHLVYGRDTMGGNRPNHGPFSIDRLLRKRNESMTEGDLVPHAGTYPDPLPPYTHVDCASTLTNAPVDINVLANDWDGNGDALTVTSFSTNTTKGGTVSWVNNGTLRYLPAPGYIGKDLFAYTVRDSTGLKTRDLVHVEVMNRELEAAYAFEETSGKSAGDLTGNGHPGKLQGATDFSTHSEPGVSGLALRVDSGGIICDDNPLMPLDAPVNGDYNYWPFDAEAMSRGNFFDPMDESCTIAFWFKASDTSTTRSLLKKQWYDEQAVGFKLNMSSGGLTATVREFNGLSSTKTLTWTTALASARWYHVALQFDRTANLARLYVDGVQRATAALDAGRFIFQGRHPLLLGADAGGQVTFDEFRYYSKALSVAEIQALYSVGQIPASGPSPADTERDVALSPTLTWLAGRANYQHDVFFGTNLAAIAVATTNSPEYAGRRLVANYNPGTLLPNTTYYWRVDEILGGTNVAPGGVWSFISAPDAIHGGLKLQLTLDARDTVGNTTYDRAGPPFNDGSLYNTPASVSGQVAEAFEFNGTSQYIEVPALNLTTDTMTFLAWVRRNGTINSYSGIVFHRGSSASGMDVSTSNRLGYHWNNAANTYNFNSGLTLPDGQWALAVLVVQTNRAIVYLGTINGVLSAATNNVTHGLSTFDSPLRVASDSTSSTRYFKGALDEIGVWNRALTREEIGAILTNGIAGGGIDGPPPLPQPGTFTWTGNTDNSWINAGNWAANATPVASDTVTFDESSARNLSTDLGVNTSVAGVLVTGKLRALGIASAGGHPLTLGSGGINLSNSFTTLTLAAPAILLSNQTWAVSEFATLNVNSNVSNTGRMLTLAADGSASIASVLTGSGGLIKNGVGTVTMTAGLQTLTGGLTVSNGTLKALGGGWATSFFANVSPRTISVHSNATLETTTHSLGGLGGSFYQPVITLNGGATWQMDAEQYLSGGNLVLNGAKILIQANDLRLQGGTVAINSSALPSTITGGGTITLYGNSTFNVANGPLATDASIDVPIGNSGNRTFTKSGTGTLAIKAPATYYGPTTISAGTLSLLGGKDTLPQAMSVSIGSGAMLALNNSDQTLSSLTGNGNVQLGYGTLTLSLLSAQIYGGIISGSPVGAPPSSGNTEESPNPGGFTKAGTGQITLTGVQTFTGDTLINSGTLALSGSGSLFGSSNLVISTGGVLDVTGRSGASVPLAGGQTLKGNGVVQGAVLINANATVSPGASIGTLTTGGQTWAGGGIYHWEIDHATIPASWDSMTVNGTVNVTATSGNPFTLRCVSPSGPLAGFNAASNHTWIIATTTGGVLNLVADDCLVDVAGLGIDPAGGTFFVEQQGSSLALRFNAYVPPATTPPVFTGITYSNDFISLSVTGAPGQTFVLQATTNLVPASWQLLATQAVSGSGQVLFFDPQATNHTQRFYRVNLQP